MRYRTATVVGLLLGVAVLLAAAPLQLPEEVGGAIAEYEESVAPEDWLDGPVEYLLTDDERDIWDDLESDEMRRQFIEWFWARRDDDPRDDQNPFKREFYERVAYTNRRFSGFPRGWRSDRGRVWILLGRPDSIRRTSLARYGRCASREGELWTYYTNDMPIRANFGEFPVIFVETRPGQLEICDPSMLGLGGWPVYLQDAVRLMRRTFIVDPVTEFDPDEGVRRASPDEVRDTEATEQPLEVPLDSWGDPGIGGVVVLPVRIPLREIFFEPLEDRLQATLQVSAVLRPQEGQPMRGSREWVLSIANDQAEEIGVVEMRTAVAMNAEPGDYTAALRVVDPLSATAWVWEGPVTVETGGEGVTPPLVGAQVARLHEGGEMAVLSRDVPRAPAGRPLAVVAWARGADVARDDVQVLVTDDDGNERGLDVEQVAWGPLDAGGPLMAQVATSGLPAGEYSLRVRVGELESPEAVVHIE